MRTGISGMFRRYVTRCGLKALEPLRAYAVTLSRQLVGLDASVPSKMIEGA